MFLHGILKEEVCVEKPHDFEEMDKKTHVQVEESVLWIETIP